MLKLERRKAVIGTINVRPENHGDEHVPAVDIPVKIHGKANKLFPMFVRGASETSTDAFWMPDGSVRFPALGPLTVSGKIENVEMLVTEEDPEARVITTLREGKVTTVTLKPQNDGMVEVSFKFQCRPGDDDWKRLVHLMKEECWIQIDEKQLAMELEPSEVEEDEEAEEIEEEGA